MAILPGLFPNATTGLPAPVKIMSLFRRWSPKPERFIFRDMLPEIAYDTNFIAYDVMRSPTGRLAAGNEDSPPASTTAMRKFDRAILAPTYYDRLQELKPSDFTNSVKPGTLDQIDPEFLVMTNMEEIAIAIEVENEIQRIGALSGTIQPTLWGQNDKTYTYPVQTFDVVNDAGGGGYSWSDTTNSKPISDLKHAAIMMRGKGDDPHLYLNLKYAGYLAENAQIVNLCKQSVYANQLGPGAVAGSEAVSNQGVAALIKQFTGIENITVYDEGWKDVAETYNVFLPDAVALLVGKPPNGQPLGHVAAAKVIHNGSVLAPKGGRFLIVKDLTETIINGPYQMYGGIKMAVALPFPECIIRMAV